MTMHEYIIACDLTRAQAALDALRGMSYKASLQKIRDTLIDEITIMHKELDKVIK